MTLFRNSHPVEYEYFRSAIAQDLNAGEHGGVDESRLIHALEQLPGVSVSRACPCGEPTCSTFSFADHSCDCIMLSTPAEMVVIEFDGVGNLTGVEKVPNRTPPAAHSAS
jgi:hypothetical protein